MSTKKYVNDNDKVTYYEYDSNGLLVNKETPTTYSVYNYDEYARLTQVEISINALQTQGITSYEYSDNNQVVYITTEYLSVKTL